VACRGAARAMVFAVCVFAGAARAATDPGGHVDEYSSFASLSANGPLDLYEAVRHGPGDGPYPFGGDPRPFNPEWQMSLPRESYTHSGVAAESITIRLLPSPSRAPTCCSCWDLPGSPRLRVVAKRGDDRLPKCLCRRNRPRRSCPSLARRLQPVKSKAATSRILHGKRRLAQPQPGMRELIQGASSGSAHRFERRGVVSRDRSNAARSPRRLSVRCRCEGNSTGRYIEELRGRENDLIACGKNQ